MIALLIIQPNVANSAAKITAGSKCPKAGLRQVYLGKTFTCIKLGTHLYWDNGLKTVVPTKVPTPNATHAAVLIPAPAPTITSTPVPTPVPTQSLSPIPVSNLQAMWGDHDSINLSFNWNSSDPNNQSTENFSVEFYDSAASVWKIINGGDRYAVTSFIAKTSTSQSLKIPVSDILETLEDTSLISNISQIGIATNTSYSEVGAYVITNLPPYISPLPQPIFTVSAGIDSYSVNLDNANLQDAVAHGLYGIVVEEQVTQGLNKSNISLTNGWQQAGALSSASPVVIFAPDGAHRWVKVAYSSSDGTTSTWSNIEEITPLPLNPDNTKPPLGFISATMTWIGDDLSIGIVPSDGAATRARIKLVPYIHGVESQTLSGDYYFPTLNSDNSPLLIKSAELYGQFGTYNSEFKAYISAESPQGVDSLSPLVVGPAIRPNELAGVTP